MGCGVSKQDIAEPSRIQQVVVRAGSPTKSQEVAAQNAVNTTPVTQGNSDTVTATPCTSPVSAAAVKLPPPTPPPATPAPVAPADSVGPPATSMCCPKQQLYNVNEHFSLGLRAKPEHTVVANGTPVLPFPDPTSNGDECTCPKLPEAKTSALALGRTSNGLVGTLASLDEILNAQETFSIKSKLKVTADKIVNYGGVLRSLENTVELQAASEEQEQNKENEPRTAQEQESEVESGSESGNVQSAMSPVGSNSEAPDSPTTLPSLEVARKKLPPLDTPPSFMIDKGTDPFVKAPLPPQLLKLVSTPTTHDIPVSPIDLTSQVLPLLNSPPQSTMTETLAIEHIKDITVVNGAPGFDHEKCSSPKEWTSLEDLHSEDAELDNIILLETLEAGDCNDGNFGSRVNHINHNIRVTSLTSELGVSSNGQQSPFSPSPSRA